MGVSKPWGQLLAMLDRVLAGPKASLFQLKITLYRQLLWWVLCRRYSNSSFLKIDIYEPISTNGYFKSWSKIFICCSPHLMVHAPIKESTFTILIWLLFVPKIGLLHVDLGGSIWRPSLAILGVWPNILVQVYPIHPRGEVLKCKKVLELPLILKGFLFYLWNSLWDHGHHQPP